MKKRVLSALLVLCMACSMVSTVWATETNATSGAPEAASQTLNLDNGQPGDESGADSTGAPSDSTDSSTSASSDSTSSGSSSAASDATSGAVSDATSGEGDESAASSDSTAASDSTSSSSSASSDSSDSDADDQDAASSDVTGDESGTGAEEESDLVTEQPSAGPESVPSQLNSAPEAAPLTVADEFTATWHSGKNTSPEITVKLVDEQGEPVQTDVSDQRFSSDSGFDLTEGVDNDLVPVIEGYTYQSARYTVGSSDKGALTYFRVKRANNYWRYYLSENAEDWMGTSFYDSSKLTIYLTYKENKASGPVIITNDIASSGNLVASVTDPSYKEKEITYKWYRNSSTDPNGSTDPITPETVTGTQKNVGNEWLNVALDIESLCNDYPGTDSDAVNARNEIRKTQYTYTVEAYDDNTFIGEATFVVPYYAQLMNGSFETPECDNSSYQPYYENGAEGVYWSTTAQDQKIEFVSTATDKSNKWGDDWYSYSELSDMFHHTPVAADGEQYAELNGNYAGSLYQDVLTVPNADLTWSVAHRGRDKEANTENEDTMYVLIMSQKLATEKNVTTQKKVLEVIDDVLHNNAENYPGASVTTVSTNNKQWKTYGDEYKVPAGQYLTRFFFVAGKTASGDQTVGNSIDDVWFSPELPDPEEDKGHLVVTKNVTGLTAADLTNYQVTIAVTGNKANVEPQTITGTSFTDPDEDGVYTARVSFQNLPVGNYTVTETVSGVPEGFNAGNSTYQIGSGDAQSGKVAAVTISNGETTGLTFINPYTKNEPAEPVDPEIRKYVDDNEDGTYSLSLDVTGDVNVKESTVPLNVLYILDESYSMMWDMDGSYPDDDEVKNDKGRIYNHSGDNRYAFEDEERKEGQPYGPYTDYSIDYTNPNNGRGTYSYTRYNTAKSAIETLNEVLAANTSLDVQVAMVDFAREAPNSAGNTVSWTSLANFEVADADYDLFASGTNYQAAFNEANEMLDLLPPNRENAQTIVIFVTDGNPNRYDEDNTDGEFDGSNFAHDNAPDEIRKAVETARDDTFNLMLKKLKSTDKVYAIGVSDDVELENLQLLFSKVPNGQGSVTQSDDTNELINYFRGIASEVVGATYCTDVTITDTFSQYAQLVDPQLVPTITITDEEGNKVEVVTPPEELMKNTEGGKTTYTGIYTFSDGGTQRLIYTYNSQTRQFTLDFPENYALHDGWTYTITVQIEPTETAYTEYAQNKKQEGNNGYGNVVGDRETDVPGSDQAGWTSSGKPGFYSNTSATLQYDSGDEDDKTKNYLRPVIQVTTGKLTITKAVSGLPDSTDVSGQKFSFTVTGKYADGSPVTGTYGGYTFDREGKTTVKVQGTGFSTLTHLPEGTYTVTETTTGLPGIAEGYRFDHAKYKVGDQEISDVAVSAGSNSAITVTNVYTLNTTTLTVTKYVEGPMGDTSDKNVFSFVLTLKDKDNSAYTQDIPMVGGEKLSYNSEAQGYPFTLYHEQTATFEIPYGLTATVEETDPKGYTPSLRVDYNPDAQAQVSSGDSKPSEEQNGYKKGTTTGNIQMTYNHSVEFRNFRGVVAPTGLESNHTTPYVLMITAAGMAGLALIGGIVARRIRRRRQE